MAVKGVLAARRASSLAGACVLVVGAAMLYGSRPTDARYQTPPALKAPSGGLLAYIADQRRATAVVLVGSALELVAVILSAFVR